MHQKDKFYEICNKLRVIGYKGIMWFTYSVKAYQKTKGLSDIPQEKKKEIKQYWRKHAGINIPLKEYKWYLSREVNIVPQIIPDVIWHSKIEPYFSNVAIVKAFSDKNYLDCIIGKENVPHTLIRCIRGELLDENYCPIDMNKIGNCFDNDKEYICKPSIESGGGRSILFLCGKEIDCKRIMGLVKDYHGNFVIQEVIKQNEILKKFNETSLNTLRVLSFLYKGKVYILNSFLRIGSKGSKVDNLSSGGYCIQVDREGHFGSFLLAKYDKFRHENNYDISKSEIFPCWDKVVELVIHNHYKLSQFKIINWDIAITKENKVIVVEYNLIDSSVADHQTFVGPIFGDLTEEVLHEVFTKGKK